MKVNVLLTGAGGNLAHFIRSALRASALDIRIVTCDYSHFAVGLYQEKTGYVVPPAKDGAYLSRMMEICKKEEIHIIMAGGMVEQRILAAHADEFRQKTGAIVLSSSPEALLRMEDKYELARYLESAGLNFPRSVLPSNGEDYQRFVAEMPFPYVVKDRLGAGSQSIGIAREKDQLDYLLGRIPNPVVQEYLYPDDEEYTVGVFADSHHRPVGSIVMKRWLDLGLTYKAQVLPDSDLGPYCERIVEGLGCLGPANVQLRLTDRGPVAFEINARFSSTTSARAHYGFNEAEMSIRHFVLNEALSRPVVRGGTFFRVIEDVFVDNEIIEKVAATGCVKGRK